MPPDLHEQLAAELGISPAEAEHALRDLLRDVKERVEAGEDVSLPQLGTFSVDEGTLRFTPSPPLQKAVNYRNDHLAPLTVHASPDAPSTPSDEPDPLMEEPPPLKDAPADESFAPVEPPASHEEEEERPPEADDEAADETPDDDPETVAALSEDWTEELDEDAPSPTPDEEQAATKSTAASTGQVAGLVASIVGLALLIWFALGLQGIVTGPGALFGADEQTAPASADTVAATPPAADTAAADASSPDPDASLDTAETQTPPESPATPPTIDRSSGGWTIVVTSRARPGEAKAVYESYQQRFLGSDVPVDILTGTSGGQVRYRVAIGQYASRESALTAQQDLQDRLPDDAWILRIQPNS